METRIKEIESNIRHILDKLETIMDSAQLYPDCYENVVEAAFEELSQPEMYPLAKAALMATKTAGNKWDWDLEYLNFELDEWYKGQVISTDNVYCDEEPTKF